MEQGRKIVLGLGNTLNRDEGLGVYILNLLAERLGSRTDVEFIDGGVLGLNLLPWVEESSYLLVLDAVNAGEPPGTLVELTRDQIPMFSGIKMSDHQITFQEVLGLASFREKLPQYLHLIGIQPLDISIGMDLSPVVHAAVPRALDKAEECLLKWGLLK